MSALPSREEIERAKKICAEAGVEFVGVQQTVDPRVIRGRTK